jgi:hypothetical protein
MLSMLLPICIGCWPPEPPDPPEPQPCEGPVASPTTTGADLISRNHSTVSFGLDNCLADYVFVGPDGIPTVYNNWANSVTASISHTDVSKNQGEEARIYLANRSITYARYSLHRNEVQAQGNGLVWAWNGNYLIFNTFLYETYERLSIGWPYGTHRNVWVGQSYVELHANSGGELPRDIDQWLVRHNYTSAYSLPILSQSMTTGPALGGNPLWGTSSNNYTFSGGRSTTGQAPVLDINFDGGWMLLLGNAPTATATITN